MTLRARFLGIRLLAMDVDGVLTRGGIEYADAGTSCHEGKTFFVRDGSALKVWHEAGFISAIITGRKSPLVSHRASEIGVTHTIQGCHDKAAALRSLLADLHLPTEAACFVGDDVIDVGAMTISGLAVAVADACAEARGCAHYITAAPGGRGAVREVTERILRCIGRFTV
jgi:3-deoxy-D-manno-octulosonate 8-phosphate phosphatase (KDO 8-P phosphatase)